MDTLARIDRRAREQRVARETIVRDLMLSRILSALFASTAKRELALKGGFAMRAAMGSVRYTKDLDLQTGPETPKKRVETLLNKAIAQALELGILTDVVVSNPKNTDTVQRYKVGGTIVGGGSEVHMTVEISRRGLPAQEDIATIAYAPDPEFGTRAVFIESYSPGAIAAGKVDALLNPNRVEPRDLYDLYKLSIEMRIDPPTHLLKAMGRDFLANGLVELWPKLETMTWELARDELLPNLPRREAAAMDEIEWDNMRMRTEEAIRAWMQLALDEIDREAEAPVPVP